MNHDDIDNDDKNQFIYQKNKKNKKKISTNINIQQKTDVDNKSKRLMCNNILKTGKCCYGNRCVFSHTLKEQRKDPNRQIVYDIISKKNNDYTYDDLKTIYDKEIIKIFYLFTKKCSLCEQNKCPGGYNCVTGTISQQYVLCINDLNNGCCSDNKCKKIHLSKKGYKLEKKINNMENNIMSYNTGITLDDSFFYKINCMKYDSISGNNNISDDSDLDSCGSYERIKDYLNDDDSGTYEESIFIFN